MCNVIVQIAPYKYGNNNVGALLQEQQTKTMAFANTGMVVITDLIDSVTNILNRKEKKTLMVRNRLALYILDFTCEGKDGKIMSLSENKEIPMNKT